MLEFVNEKNNLLFQSYNSFSIQNLQISNLHSIFNSIKKFANNVIEAYKDGATIKDKVAKVYSVAKEQAIANSLRQNLIIAATTTTSGYLIAEQAGLLEEDEKEGVAITLSTSISAIDEDSNQSITITATLATPATTALTLEFSPTGSATEGTDYDTKDGTG